MRKHQCSGKDPSEFSKPISMQSDWWKEREGNQGGVGKGSGRTVPKHLKHVCNDPTVQEGIIQFKYEKDNFRFLHCSTLHTKRENKNPPRDQLEEVQFGNTFGCRTKKYPVPLALQTSLHLSFGDTPANLGVHSTAGPLPKADLENSLCFSHCSSLNVFPAGREKTGGHEIISVHALPPQHTNPGWQKWGKITVVVRAVLNVTGPVLHSLPFAVLAPVPGDGVVTFPEGILHSPAAAPGALAPRPPGAPAPMHWRLERQQKQDTS